MLPVDIYSVTCFNLVRYVVRHVSSVCEHIACYPVLFGLFYIYHEIVRSAMAYGFCSSLLKVIVVLLMFSLGIVNPLARLVTT